MVISENSETIPYFVDGSSNIFLALFQKEYYMKISSITIFFLFTSIVSVWGFQFEEMKNPDSPSSKMYKKVYQALGAGKYDLAEARLDSTLILFSM